MPVLPPRSGNRHDSYLQLILVETYPDWLSSFVASNSAYQCLIADIIALVPTQPTYSKSSDIVLQVTGVQLVTYAPFINRFPVFNG